MLCMRDLDYWTSSDGRPKPLVDLAGAPCRRCPHPIRLVPRDKVSLERVGGHYRRSFVCPHCRAESVEQISRREALRLYGEGAAIVRTLRVAAALTHEEIRRFTDALYGVDDLAGRALDDASA